MKSSSDEEVKDTGRKFTSIKKAIDYNRLQLSDHSSEEELKSLAISRRTGKLSKMIAKERIKSEKSKSGKSGDSDEYESETERS